MRVLLTDHRRRRWVSWWGRSFQSLPVPRVARLALFCDCEGHFGGPAAEPFAEAGVDRLLTLLARHRLHITFNVVADLCRSYPQRIRRIIAAGHEIACHGRRHERPRDLSRAQLGEMLRGAIDDFASVGARPTGFRSPESAWSIELLRALPRHGFTWNAEHDRAASPYRIAAGLVRIPVHTDDWDLVDGTADAAGLLAKWRSRVLHAIDGRSLITLGVHDWVIGRNANFAAGLDALLHEWSAAGMSFVRLGGLLSRAHAAENVGMAPGKPPY